MRQAVGHLVWAVAIVGALNLITLASVLALAWSLIGKKDPVHEVKYDAADVVWTSAASGSGTCVGYFPDGSVVVTNKPEFMVQNGEALLDPSLPSVHPTVAEWGPTS